MNAIAPPVVRSVDGVFVLELGEEYSHLHESLVENLSVMHLLADSIEPAKMVLDMSNVKVIGTALIGALVTVSKQLAARSGGFALANANKFCQAAIGVTNLDSLLPMYDSTEAAVLGMCP